MYGLECPFLLETQSVILWSPAQTAHQLSSDPLTFIDPWARHLNLPVRVPLAPFCLVLSQRLTCTDSTGGSHAL